MKQKLLVAALALTLVLCLALGATLAWLTDKTISITNTFTFGNINITLTETNEDPANIKMILGQETAKDPKVTVEANSEKCWLFVEVVEGSGINGLIAYSVNTGEEAGQWKAVDGQDGWYYMEVETSAQAQEFYVLADVNPENNEDNADGSVMIKDGVEKDTIDALTGDEDLTLTFTAYAIQYEAASDVAAAQALAAALKTQA